VKLEKVHGFVQSRIENPFISGLIDKMDKSKYGSDIDKKLEMLEGIKSELDIYQENQSKYEPATQDFLNIIIYILVYSGYHIIIEQIYILWYISVLIAAMFSLQKTYYVQRKTNTTIISYNKSLNKQTYFLSNVQYRLRIMCLIHFTRLRK
jgi:hypothetical protein